MKKTFLFSLIFLFQANNLISQNSSILSSGDWYKISTNRDGIYKIDYSDLENLGVNLSSLTFQSVKLYGNGKGMLPELNYEFRHNDLVENAIKVYDQNSNGFFDENDYLLFFGHSPTTWRFNESTGLFNHEINLYSDYVYFFLTINNNTNGKRIDSKNIVGSSSINITSFNSFDFHELEQENLISSGRQWFGERFSVQQEQVFNFSFPSIDVNYPINISSSFAARSLQNSVFNLQINSIPIESVVVNKISGAYATEYAKTSMNTTNFNISEDDLELKIEYSSSDNGAIGWLNYIEINTRRMLKMDSDYLLFRDATLFANEVATFNISNVSSDVLVWDVTDHANVKEMTINILNNSLSFNDSINELNEYIAFNNNSYLSPNFHGYIENQNLHNVDENIEYVIVVHPDFITSAQRLAQLHFERSNLKSIIVTPEQLYNEFSSGSQDVSAIRDFLRMIYKKSESQLKYLLLFGDGSYDPKERIINNTNYIPTYQSQNSTHPIYSYVTDDYFALLDDDEGLFNSTDQVDIGVGRFPVTSLTQADILVNKVEVYNNNESFGSWRNNIVFVADDGDSQDGNTHMWQADSLANYISDNYDEINIHKIYLDNYYQESTTAGPRSPTAQYSINNRIDQGALLVNYTGHGSPLGWTKERILELDQINSWNNINKQPLFMTATCKFSYFDDPENISAGEQVLLNPNGGAIGLLSTTRLVYSPPNYNLNSKFIRTLFNKDSGEYLRLGDIVKKTKVLSGSSTNNRNFILLGDPALRLAYPIFDINTTSINDTLKALQEVTIEGQVESNGNVLSNFNGEIFVSVFDKEIIQTTLGQESCTPMPYREQNKILYKGSASVIAGKFSFSFIVPKDIEYNFGLVKISYYALNDNVEFPVDANGSIGKQDSIYIGGTASDINYDFHGADIDLFMNTRNFINGGITDRNPILIADIIDESGINTVGNGIGHDITAVLDGNTANVYVLNDFYVSKKDNFREGVIRFPFYNLEPGEHTIKLKIWDVFNNSSEKEINFTVIDDNDVVISDFTSYPNPFSNFTDIYFEHNQVNKQLDFRLDIYSITGVLIKSFETSIFNNIDYRVGPISWDGRDKYGNKVSAGVYFLNLGITLNNGQFTSKSKQIILLPD